VENSIKESSRNVKKVLIFGYFFVIIKVGWNKLKKGKCMQFTKEIDKKLKELFTQKAFSEDELKLLAEIITLAYEEGKKEGVGNDK